MFFGEIIAITTVSSVPGILFSSYVIKKIVNSGLISSGFLSYNIFIVTVSILLVYVFNLLVGLIPVYNVIRKTPASILSRYDLD